MQEALLHHKSQEHGYGTQGGVYYVVHICAISETRRGTNHFPSRKTARKKTEGVGRKRERRRNQEKRGGIGITLGISE